MKITYLGHSGFSVEFEDRMLVFDYYEGTLPPADKEKRLYVFASHSHEDHFQEKIFEWEEQGYDVTYILSSDIRPRGRAEKMLSAGPRRTFDVDDMQVKTLRSTDKGVAFFVYVKGKRIYHAGDLNWWHWEEESAAFNEMMKRKYQYEIDRIGDLPVDVAFVPLDPRQEDYYALGMDYFLSLNAGKKEEDRIYPMHCWEDYRIIDRWLKEHPDHPDRDKIVRIQGRGESFKQ